MIFLKLIFQLSLIFSSLSLFANHWVYYGTVQIPAGTLIDNPAPNTLGIEGEISSLPYTVPSGYNLEINYIQVEGPPNPQLGLGLWLGDFPCTNEKWIISCTTIGGSHDLYGMKIIIPEGKKLNIRMMNNTSLAWVDGFFLQGKLVER